MRGYNLAVYEFFRHLIPSFLQGIGGILNWVTGDGQIWVDASGDAWTSTTQKNRHMHWVECMLRPLVYVNASLVNFVFHIRYRLSITGQVIYLEKYLNDLHDPTLREIYISDDTQTEQFFLYLKQDDREHSSVNLKADGAAPLYLYNKANFFNDRFTVWIPDRYVLDDVFEKRIRIAVNRYKIAGPTYSVKSYTP